jgi:hypothetical protein
MVHRHRHRPRFPATSLHHLNTITILNTTILNTINTITTISSSTHHRSPS